MLQKHTHISNNNTTFVVCRCFDYHYNTTKQMTQSNYNTTTNSGTIQNNVILLGRQRLMLCHLLY